RQLRDGPALGPAQVRHHHHAGAPPTQVAQRAQRGPHARVVCDRAFPERHVQVLAHEHALPAHVQSLVRSLHAYSRSATYVIRSTSRQLKPHSLSYQETTFAERSPSISVAGASTIDECGSFLKSDDTSSSWLTARMPLSEPPAASSNAALISSTVVARP